MQSDNKKIIDNVGWVISDMINHGSDDIIKKVIQADHCIDYYIDKEHTIPFDGIGQCVLQLQPKAKQIEIIYVTSEGEDPHKYNYDKNKTCQFYFDSFITVFQS